MQPGKDPFPLCREGGGLNDCLLGSQSCIPHHKDGMAGGQLNELHEAPLWKQWKEQLLSALLAWATDHCQETHMATNGILHRVAALQTLTFNYPIGDHGSHMGTWKQKANAITGTNMQQNELVGGLTLKEKTPEEDPWHKWHIPKKASQTEVVAIAAHPWG